MSEEFTHETAFSTLKAALEAVSKEEAGVLKGANDKWLADLLVKVNADEAARGKISSLQFLDQLLRSFGAVNFPKHNCDEAERTLGRLVDEIRGYQDLTERFFSDLRKLTSKDQALEGKAAEARKNLFAKLSQVQTWLFEKRGTSPSPSEFGPCTNQFLSRINSKPQELSRTQKLFRNQSLELSESDLRSLTDAWGEAVSTFVEDAQDTDQNDSLQLGNPETIAQYLCIHNRLETLYVRLGTNVSLIN